MRLSQHPIFLILGCEAIDMSLSVGQGSSKNADQKSSDVIDGEGQGWVQGQWGSHAAKS